MLANVRGRGGGEGGRGGGAREGRGSKPSMDKQRLSLKG